MMAEQLRRTAPGGIGTYVRGMIQGLDQLEGAEAPRVELIASRPRAGRDDALAPLGHPVRNSPLPSPLLTRCWDHGLLRAPSGFDVVHSTSLSTMEPGRAASVATVHDLLWRKLPDAYPPHGRRWHEAALRRALRRADRFIVPATIVADDLMEAGARAESIAVIPMGSDHQPAPDRVAGAALLARAGVHGPFLLSVGTLEPRKNLKRLIEAYEMVRPSLPEPWPLLVVGPTGWGEQIRPDTGVVLTGMITAPELSALYATTRLLAYVPLIEGFGLPPVEAMAFGAPVVASPLPSTDGAAFEVDPRDVGSIAEGLLRVATDHEERLRLQAAGERRSAQLTWASIARRHVEVWCEATDSRSGSHGGSRRRSGRGPGPGPGSPGGTGG